MHLGSPAFGLEGSNALIIIAGKFKMDGTHLVVECGRGCSPLRGRSTPVINQVSFHSRHPPMAGLNETQQCESLNRLSDISSVGPLTHSLRSSR